LPNKQVSIVLRTSGTFDELVSSTTATTDYTGRYVGNVGGAKSGTHTLTVTFSGDSEYAATSMTFDGFQVVPLPNDAPCSGSGSQGMPLCDDAFRSSKRTDSVRISQSSVQYGERFNISGKLKDLSKVPLKLEVWNPCGKLALLTQAPSARSFDGYYFTQVYAKGPNFDLSGIYTITASHNGVVLAENTFPIQSTGTLVSSKSDPFCTEQTSGTGTPGTSTAPSGSWKGSVTASGATQVHYNDRHVHISLANHLSGTDVQLRLRQTL